MASISLSPLSSPPFAADSSAAKKTQTPVENLLLLIQDIREQMGHNPLALEKMNLLETAAENYPSADTLVALNDCIHSIKDWPQDLSERLTQLFDLNNQKIADHPYDFIKDKETLIKCAPFFHRLVSYHLAEEVLKNNDYSFFLSIWDKNPSIQLNLLTLLESHSPDLLRQVTFESFKRNLYYCFFYERPQESVLAKIPKFLPVCLQWIRLSGGSPQFLKLMIERTFEVGDDVSTLFQLIQTLEYHISYLNAEQALAELEKPLDVPKWDEMIEYCTKAIDQAFHRLLTMSFDIELIEPFIQRKGKPISVRERKWIDQMKGHLPDLNRTLLSYELLQKKTQRMDLSQFKKVQVTVLGKTFEMYDTTEAPNWSFLVHSAGLDVGPPERVVQSQKIKGFLCASFLSKEINFMFNQKQRYGLVLAAHPKSYVATSREDGSTPYAPVEHPEEFYCFYRRLQLLTGYIDRLYRESGLQGLHPTDDYQRLNRLLSMQKDEPHSVDRSEIEQLQIKIFGRPMNQEQLLADYYLNGMTLRKVKALIAEYGSRPDQAHLLKEAQRAEVLLKNILRDSSIYHYSIQPMQSANELHSQTRFQYPHKNNLDGNKPYNEVNIDLTQDRYDGKEAIEVKAILIDQEGLEHDPTAFIPILENAAAKGLPILFKKTRPLSHAEAFNKLKTAVANSDLTAIHKLKNEPNLTEKEGGEALLIAISNASPLYVSHPIITSVFETLLHTWPTIPATTLEKAFELCIHKGAVQIAQEILNLKTDVLKETATGYLLFGSPSPKDRLKMVDILMEASVTLLFNLAKTALRDAIGEKNKAMALKIFDYQKWPPDIKGDLEKAMLDAFPESQIGK